jgi:hypothetical protein
MMSEIDKSASPPLAALQILPTHDAVGRNLPDCNHAASLHGRRSIFLNPHAKIPRA